MILTDTDHLWGIGGNAAWVWKAFTRGHNPLFMDPYDGIVFGASADARWEEIRQAMGQARRLAERVNLATMTPHEELASTKYCLANVDQEYLVYLPDGRRSDGGPISGDRDGDGGVVQPTHRRG